MPLFHAQFPLDPTLSYLNHAAVSPWPKATADAVKAFAEENATTGAQYYPRWLEVEKQLRQKLAQLLNVEGTREIALAKNTSEALSIIAYGLSWQPGDEVIISNQEFPSNRIVWESLTRFGVKVIQAEISLADPVAALINACTERTRLISISSVQYASGIRVDLEALGQACRARDILLCVDAIQSLGALPFDQQKIQADFVVADGHKWMMGPEGLALLYVNAKHIETLTLHQFGWHMIQHRGDYSRTDWTPATDATRFECGSPNMLGIVALNASLGVLLEIGLDKIQQELETRVDYLIAQLDAIAGLKLLSPRERDKRGGIVTFLPSLPGNTTINALHQHLMQQGVICASRGGGIRFSPHFYTSQESIDRAIAILKGALKGPLK